MKSCRWLQTFQKTLHRHIYLLDIKRNKADLNTIYLNWSLSYHFSCFMHTSNLLIQYSGEHVSIQLSETYIHGLGAAKRVTLVLFCWLLRNLSGFVPQNVTFIMQYNYPDSKVHGANMGPTWVLTAQDGPYVGPTNLAIRVYIPYRLTGLNIWWCIIKWQGQHWARFFI